MSECNLPITCVYTHAGLLLISVHIFINFNYCAHFSIKLLRVNKIGHFIVIFFNHLALCFKNVCFNGYNKILYPQENIY